jgi:hypothetical protein
MQKLVSMGALIGVVHKKSYPSHSRLSSGSHEVCRPESQHPSSIYPGAEPQLHQFSGTARGTVPGTRTVADRNGYHLGYNSPTKKEIDRISEGHSSQALRMMQSKRRTA